MLPFGVTELESQDETADKAARQLGLIGLNIGGRPSITLQSGSYWAHSAQAPSSHSDISSVCLHRNMSYYCPEAAVTVWMGCYCGSKILRGQNLLPELSNYTSSSVSHWSLLIISKHMAASAVSYSLWLLSSSLLRLAFSYGGDEAFVSGLHGGDFGFGHVPKPPRLFVPEECRHVTSAFSTVDIKNN